ncbi:hypothetical protein SprV_0100108100 [Sparganum proliferum]
MERSRVRVTFRAGYNQTAFKSPHQSFSPRVLSSLRWRNCAPSDDLMNETDRRRTEGLSPLRGDSRYSTPALSISGELSNASPAVGAALTASLTQMVIERTRGKNLSCRGRGHPRHSRRGRWQNRRLPVSGNYPDYYSRRDPEDRIKFLMPEWFSNGDIADYGCHNGTLTFRILEKFPDIHKIDAFDCDPELIENAKSMQRERIRWGAQANTKYDKINFQVANWSECSSFDDEPTYNTILAFSAVQQENYKGMTIDPSNLEPLLLDVGFSYFDKIKVPRANEAFQRHIILCSKSYGATPSSIRNDCRSENQMWRDSPSSDGSAPRGPPPVNYCPQTPSYTALVSPRSSVHFPTPEPSTTTPDSLHFEAISSTVPTVEAISRVPVEASPLLSIVDNSDVTVSVPDSTSEQ